MTVSISLLGGCTKTVSQKLARFDSAENSAPTTQPVRDAGLYEVRVKSQGERTCHPLKDGSVLWVAKGAPVGFRRTQDGSVRAFADTREFPLVLPDSCESVIWYARVQKQTGFGHEVDKVVDKIGSGIGAAGRVVANSAAETNEKLGRAGVDAGIFYELPPDTNARDSRPRYKRHSDWGTVGAEVDVRESGK
ncbi:MAG: hypothetical protein ABSH20_23970 [Tepidisphaeraceae bacterium]